MSDQNWTTEEIGLAKTMYLAAHPSWDFERDGDKNYWMKLVRAALKWCAEHPPAMSVETREKFKQSIAHDLQYDEAAIERALVKAGAIPPRREKSIGEIVRDIVLKGDPSLAAGKIDELLGKLVELAKAAQVPERDAYDQYYDWHDRIKAKAEDALAPIEALKAVQKKE